MAVRSSWLGRLNFVIRGLSVIMLTSLIVGAAGLLILHSRGQRLLSVQTASMAPTIRPGDAVVVEPARAGQLQVGDIISYRSPRDPRVVITHRLIAIDRQGQLTTAGDALHTTDLTFPPHLVIGRATAIAPRLGLALDALHRPIGLTLVFYLPALTILISEARRLAIHFSQPHYRLPRKRPQS